MEESVQRPRKFVIAMDGSQASDNAFNFYMKNIHQDSDEVVLIHCIHHTGLFSNLTTKGSEPLHPDTIAEAFKEQEDHGQNICKKLEACVEKLKGERKGNITVMRIDGDPGPSIVAQAHDCGATGIVVGSRGQGTIRRTVMGSVSDFIIHHTKIPVIFCPK